MVGRPRGSVPAGDPLSPDRSRAEMNICAGDNREEGMVSGDPSDCHHGRVLTMRLRNVGVTVTALNIDSPPGTGLSALRAWPASRRGPVPIGVDCTLRLMAAGQHKRRISDGPFALRLKAPSRDARSGHASGSVLL